MNEEPGYMLVLSYMRTMDSFKSEQSTIYYLIDKINYIARSKQVTVVFINVML